MRRLSLILFGCLVLTTPALAGDKAVKQTIDYLRKLQTDSGGFRTHDPKPDAVKILPSLRATSSAVRALHYLGGDVPDPPGAIKFIESCWDADAGGFSDQPKGKADVFSTAVGLMAVVELKMPKDKYAPAAAKFLSDKAKAFEEIRIAAAGFEAIKAKSAQNADWLKEVTKLRNKDGTFGKGLGQARDTGGAIVTLMRLGAEVDKTRSQGIKLRVIEVLKAGQRQNGGYGKDDSETASDLETTYRVMRCFMMLNAKPANVEGVRSFIAKCRNPDGGYGVAPGQPSNVSGTYFAAIVLHWLKD